MHQKGRRETKIYKSILFAQLLFLFLLERMQKAKKYIFVYVTPYCYNEPNSKQQQQKKIGKTYLSQLKYHKDIFLGTFVK